MEMTPAGGVMRGADEKVMGLGHVNGGGRVGSGGRVGNDGGDVTVVEGT